MSAYTTSGKRRSSQSHATRVYVCVCGRECRGNGGWSSHKKACPSRWVLAYTKEFREAVLRGDSSAWMCAALSAPLHAAFQVLGIPSQLVVSDLGECEHIFLHLADGRVLDPTADQFNWCSRQKLPGVYLGAPALIHERATPWAGGQEWHALMAELKRLYPDFSASEVGRNVGMVLRTLPPGLCEFVSVAEQVPRQLA